MDDESDSWIRQAEADQKTATDNILSGNYYASALFAQQAAEKALKALLARGGNKNPPKIHDLVELSRLTRAPEQVMKAAEVLTPHYILSRYPGVSSSIPSRHYTKALAERLSELSKVILEWTKKKLL